MKDAPDPSFHPLPFDTLRYLRTCLRANGYPYQARALAGGASIKAVIKPVALSTCDFVRVGPMGSDSMRPATDSETGKLPGPRFIDR